MTNTEYINRRKKLAEQLGNNAVALISAGREILRNGDAHYRFRQKSDFYYLTGSHEPEGLLLISAEKSILFNRPRDPAQEQWTGTRLGQEGACAVLGMTEAWPIENIHAQLAGFLAGKSAVYYNMANDAETQAWLFEAIEQLKGMQRKGVEAPRTLGDLSPFLSEMRLFKDEAELKLLRKATQISVEAHKRAMQICTEVLHEYELEAELVQTFLRHGCRSVAYDPIVGSGKNACILHYTDNNQPLGAHDLILIDAGGEYGNYAADISRTFPRNARFTAEQTAIYSLVLKAQKAGIAEIRPGLPWNAIQETIVRILTTGLCELGLLEGSVEDCIANGAYRSFYMHNSGHWLGLDVHDAGAYKVNGQWRRLEAGMVLTVEPGIYIQAGMPGVDPKWWNIAVRIEDDILVTQSGYENLTADLPVEIHEIEALMRGSSAN